MLLPLFASAVRLLFGYAKFSTAFVATHPPSKLNSSISFVLFPSPFSDLYANLLVGDTPVPELSTVKARRYIDCLDHISSVLNWNARAIFRLAIPLSDIWHQVWCFPLLSHHQEMWYKLLLNTLPLGTRIFPFAPE